MKKTKIKALIEVETEFEVAEEGDIIDEDSLLVRDAKKAFKDILQDALDNVLLAGEYKILSLKEIKREETKE